MPEFIVEGARKDNGQEQRINIEADDAAQAEQIAGIRGMFVSAVRPITMSSSPTQSAMLPPRPNSRAGILVGLVVMGVLAGIGFLVMAGNGTFDSETYQGKSIKEWLVLAADKDTDTRCKAVEALGHMQSPRAKDAVKNAALTDYWWEVRAMALKAYPSLRDEEELRVLEDMAKSADANYTKPVTCDPFLYRVERLKSKAASLAPVLRKLRDDIRKDRYHDEVSLELITKSLDAIEGKTTP